MHEPRTRLGPVRRATYYPARRRLRIVTAAGRTYEALDVSRTKVEAAIGNGSKLQRLVDSISGWRLVSREEGGTASSKPRAGRTVVSRAHGPVRAKRGLVRSP